MAPLTQEQIALQMVAQLRILDPSVSAEIGTPERKIIDTVAQQIAEAQVNLNLVSGNLDLTAVYGSNLDNYVGVFGFGRQQGASATGFVTFSRPTPSSFNITIPLGTQVAAVINTTSPDAVTTVARTIVFQTTVAVTLATGQLSVTAPIQALLTGSQGNVAANTITQFANVGAPVLGITQVSNPLPTSNGSDAESDSELKVRFRNTVFRNVAGTEDQYMALAVSTQFSTKANVIGPISRYREYIQIPMVDDSQFEDTQVNFNATATNGSPLLTSGTVVSGGTPEIGQLVLGPGISPGTTVLDIEGHSATLSANFTGSTGTYGFILVTGQPPDGSGGGLANHWTTSLSNNLYAKYVYTDVPYFVSNGEVGLGTLFYRQDTDFVLNVPPINAGDTYREVTEAPADLPNPSTVPNRPNVTFFNVYTGPDATVQLPRQNDVVLLEYSYLSTESRNDIARNITNCVDVYVNGENPTTASVVIPPPPGDINLFNLNPSDKFYYLNFRRIGHPTVTPTVGNVFTALFWQPVIGLPSTITVGINTFTLNADYWAVEDKTLIGNTVRSRNGIEWTPSAISAIASSGVTSVQIDGYTYDKNVVDLQAALDAKKQVTTDVLAHRATRRYFKLDLTVVYAPGASPSGTNLAIRSALTTFFDGQYFGSVIQLSDILVTVRGVFGVQNVRWSNDVLNPSDDEANQLYRVVECDINGVPLGADFFCTATNGSAAISGILITSGILEVGQVIAATGFPVGTTVTSVSGTTGVLSNNYTGVTGIIPVFANVSFDTDFALLDSELPSFPTGQLVGIDTLPGLIIRPRAQNVFNVV